MTAIVTGGLGFIGSHIVDVLAARGERVRVIDDFRWRNNGLPAFADEWPRRVTLDLASVNDATVTDCDTIYHLAGPVGPVTLMKSGGRMALEAIPDAGRIAYMARKAGARIVFVSTSEIYGPQPEGGISEDAPRIVPTGHSGRMEYAVTKLAIETMLLNMPDLDVRIVRPFNVAGPRQREDGGFVLPRFVRQAKAGETLTIYQPGTQQRAFTHVLDMVDGIVRAADNGMAGGIYNLGNPDNTCSMQTLAEDVIGLLHSESQLDIVDPRDLWGPDFAEAPDKVPDIARARTELGWNPTRDRQQVILDAAA